VSGVRDGDLDEVLGEDALPAPCSDAVESVDPIAGLFDYLIIRGDAAVTAIPVPRGLARRRPMTRAAKQGSNGAAISIGGRNPGTFTPETSSPDTTRHDQQPT